MLNVVDKRTNKLVNVFAVGEDNAGYPKFLIRKRGLWMWDSAKHYIPYSEWLDTKDVKDFVKNKRNPLVDLFS